MQGVTGSNPVSSTPGSPLFLQGISAFRGHLAKALRRHQPQANLIEGLETGARDGREGKTPGQKSRLDNPPSVRRIPLDQASLSIVTDRLSTVNPSRV